jgi:LysM repeat protein
LRGQLEQLQRENDALKTELNSRRGGAPAPLLRLSRAPAATEETRPAPMAADDSPILLAPLPAFSAKPAAPAPPPVRKHTVAPGDTLYGIARKYGVKIEDVAAANRDVLPSIIAPLRLGTELKIP